MILPLEFYYRLSNVVGCVVGIALNGFLLLAAYKTRKRVKNSVHMVTVCAVLDVLYAADELILQHLLFIYQSRLVFFSHGIDSYLPELPRKAVLAFHLYLNFQRVFLVGPLAHYNHGIIQGRVNELRTFAANILWSAAAAWVVTMLCINCLEEPEYCHVLETIIPSSATCIFSTAAAPDTRVTLFFGVASAVTTPIYVVCGLSTARDIYRLRFANSNSSVRTKLLQLQFARNLVGLLAVNVVCVVGPLLVLLGAVLLKNNFFVLGMVCYVPMTWQTVANPTISLVLIRAYRTYVRDMVSRASWKGSRSSSIGPVKTVFSQHTGRT